MGKTRLISIETISICLMFVVILTVIFVISKMDTKTQQPLVIKQEQNQNTNYPSTSLRGDVLLDPYMPPLNVSTNIGAVNTSYRQVGILMSNKNIDGRVLPLMGRPVFVNRNKWQYYTISNQHNNVKLPIMVHGRSATRDQGVDQLYSGDLVFVEGENEHFRTKIYDTDTIKYIPYL
jgi:hypothetical protein